MKGAKCGKSRHSLHLSGMWIDPREQYFKEPCKFLLSPDQCADLSQPGMDIHILLKLTRMSFVNGIRNSPMARQRVVSSLLKAAHAARFNFEER
jgi:hypothetical protein